MREILFRGKTNEGKWIEGQLLHFKASVGSGELAVIVEGCEWDNSNEWFNLGKRAKVLTETVGQYTGFTDKNGKKIFEGDIVNIEYPDAVVCNTVINYIGASFFGRRFDDDWELDDYVSLEVIGNIHDNPELLSEGE